jgi:hypothetical protein
MEIKLHTFLMLKLAEDEWSVSCSDCLYLWEEPSACTDSETGWALQPFWMWQKKKSLLLTGIK